MSAFSKILSTAARIYANKAETERSIDNLIGGVGGSVSAIQTPTAQKPPLGSFGDVVFECSHFRVVTFRDWQRGTKGRYATHNVIGLPPVLEFLGRELEEISFKMTFTTALGVNPFDEIQKVRDMLKRGEANFLIIGGHAYGENPWIVEDMTQTVEAWDGNGRMLVSSSDVKLKEYVEGVAEGGS